MCLWCWCCYDIPDSQRPWGTWRSDTADTGGPIRWTHIRHGDQHQSRDHDKNMLRCEVNVIMLDRWWAFQTGPWSYTFYIHRYDDFSVSRVSPRPSPKFHFDGLSLWGLLDLGLGLGLENMIYQWFIIISHFKLFPLELDCQTASDWI